MEYSFEKIAEENAICVILVLCLLTLKINPKHRPHYAAHPEF